MRKFWTLHLLAFLLLLPACATLFEERAFNKAAEQNTIYAYETFLTEHPEGEFRAEAERRLEDAYFAYAEDLDRPSSYNRYLTAYPNGRYAEEASEKLEKASYEEEVRSNPEQYLSIEFFPTDENGTLRTTSVVANTFMEEGKHSVSRGVISSAFMAAMLAEPGKVEIARVRVVPVLESRAEVPLRVNFDAVLRYEQNVYNSMYQYSPGGGRAKADKEIRQEVEVVVGPREKVNGDIIDFGDIKLLEAGQTWIAYLEIKRTLRELRAERIAVEPLIEGVEAGSVRLSVAGPTVDEIGFSVEAALIDGKAEFPVVSPDATAVGTLVEARINIVDDIVEFDFSATDGGQFTAVGGGFNGYVIEDVGDSLPPIVGVEIIEETTSLGLIAEDIGFTEERITVNVENLVYDPSSTAQILIDFGD